MRTASRRATICFLAATAILAGCAPVPMPDLEANQVATPPVSSSLNEPPADAQEVSFRGVQILVPASWKINDEMCGIPMSDTVLVVEGFYASCGMEQPAGLTVVRMLTLSEASVSVTSIATSPVMVNGTPGLRGRGAVNAPDASPPMPTAQSAPQSVLVLEAVGVVITAESPEAKRAESLLDAVSVMTTDRRGCVDQRPTNLTPLDGGELVSELVPGVVESAVICRYSNDRLVTSVALQAVDVVALQQILNRLTEGASYPPPDYQEVSAQCDSDRRRGFEVIFTVGEPHPVVVDVNIAGCDGLTASNGVRTTKINDELVNILVDQAGYDSGFPDPRTLR